MANVYFFTGFPGFIASSLIRQLVRDRRHLIERIYLLVLPEMLDTAANDVDKMAAQPDGLPRDRFVLITGDIRRPQLSMDQEVQAELRENVTHVFHLAAIYDLAVPAGIANDINVGGTNQVNQWVLTLTNIRRYVYFSTAYVSGDREGRILESELRMKQGFKNHYERTKYEAEVLVRGIMDKVPTTVIRPGVVKGNSRTGETIKFDGPYFTLNLFDALKFLPVIPYMGSGSAEGNFVPVDYIFDATLYLAHAEAGAGKTYHLTDPKPYLMRDVYRMLMKEYLGREPAGRIPLALAKLFLSLPAARKWLRVEKEALDYLNCKAQYDASEAQRDLRGSGIVCPDFQKTLGAMVQFYRQHKNDCEKQLTIR